VSWWAVLGVFVGIPMALFVTITLVVLRFTTARVPDGLAIGERPSPEDAHFVEEAPPGHESEPEDGEPGGTEAPKQ